MCLLHCSCCLRLCSFTEWKLCSGVRETADHIWKSNVCNQRWWSQHSQCSYSRSGNTCKRNLGLTFIFHFHLWPSFLLWRTLIFLFLLQVAASGSEENENFENPVYASVISASPKEPPQSTDAPQVGCRKVLRLPCLLCAPNQGNLIVREAAI